MTATTGIALVSIACALVLAGAAAYRRTRGFTRAWRYAAIWAALFVVLFIVGRWLDGRG